MTGSQNSQHRGPMASRWRRRRMCVLKADRPAPAALIEISGAGATIQSNLQPRQGSMVTLQHPVSGEIPAKVRAVHDHGIELTFKANESSVAFALSALAADMTLET